MKNLTEIVFILDRSGSMSGLESDTIGGFNSMLKKQKNEEGDALVSTVLFNHKSEVIHDRVPIENVSPLTDRDYYVGGNTALLDAIGDAIKHIKVVHKYAREEDKPNKTLFIITTDGEENSSTKFSSAEIKQLISAQQENNWEFVFLGANIDAVEVASNIGIAANRAVNYRSDSRGTKKAFHAFSNLVGAARRAERISEVEDTWREEIDEDFEERKH